MNTVSALSLTKPKKRRKPKTFNTCSGKKYDSMMGRCYRETESSYSNYGARGIRVHGAWVKDINNFRSWLLSELERMGLGVEEFVNDAGSYQLDRIDVNGHYTPSNCRITTRQNNMRNRRISKDRKVISAEGEEICFV